MISPVCEFHDGGPEGARKRQQPHLTSSALYVPTRSLGHLISPSCPCHLPHHSYMLLLYFLSLSFSCDS